VNPPGVCVNERGSALLAAGVAGSLAAGGRQPGPLPLALPRTGADRCRRVVTPHPPLGGPSRHAPRVTALQEPPGRPPRAGHRVAAQRSPSRALPAVASSGWRYTPLLTVIFHGKDPAPVGRTGEESRSAQPSWAIRRPSSHEEGLLRHRRSDRRHIDLDWLQQSAHRRPDCDGHSGPGRWPRARITSAAARNGGRAQRGGRAIHRHDRQEWPVPIVIAAWHLPADWSQSPDAERPNAVHRNTGSPCDQDQANTQHPGGLLDLVERARCVPDGWVTRRTSRQSMSSHA
jgi:hypothetical protein